MCTCQDKINKHSKEIAIGVIFIKASNITPYFMAAPGMAWFLLLAVMKINMIQSSMCLKKFGNFYTFNCVILEFSHLLVSLFGPQRK